MKPTAIGSLWIATCLTACASTTDRAVGLEFQAYPAGVVSGLRAERALGVRDLLFARVAWNDTDRRDFGEHDDERGGGPGGGVGWSRFLRADRTGWRYGARVDLWDLEIDWRDRAPAQRSGATEVLVLQPALELGYRWRIPNSAWLVDLTASVGLELNLDTSGEDVGEGPIGLIGLSVVRGI